MILLLFSSLRNGNIGHLLAGQGFREVNLLEITGARIERFYKICFSGDNHKDNRIIGCDGELLDPGLKGLIFFGFLTKHSYLGRLKAGEAAKNILKKIEIGFTETLREKPIVAPVTNSTKNTPTLNYN